MIPEWNRAYFNYNLLKEVLNPFKRVSNSLKQENLTLKLIKEQILNTKIPQEIQTKLQILDEEFVQLFQDEIHKCNQFYILQIEILNTQYQQVTEQENDLELRKNLEILFKKGNLLKQFKLYNINAIEKILKQYRYHTNFIDNSESHLTQQLNNLEFVNDTNLNKIIKYIKELYIRNDWEASELKRFIQKNAISHKLHYIGFLGGMIFFLIFSFIYQRINLTYLKISEDYSTYLLFITMGIPILYLWQFSTLLQILKKKYINYWVVFKVDYIKDSIQKFYYLAAILTIFYLVIANYGLISENISFAKQENLIYYSIFNLFEFDPILTEFIFWIMLLLFMINPIKIFGYQARIYFWKLQLKTLIGITYSKDILWNIEQMISSSQFLKLFTYSIIYYIYYFQNKNVLEIAEFNIFSQIILTIPFLYGFYYSIRQFYDDRQTLFNLIKYSLMLIIIVLGQINIQISFINQLLMRLMIIIFGFSIALIDIKYDWNLLNKKQNKILLRPILGYHPYFYYFGILYNILGRILLFDQLCTIIQSKNRLFILCIIEAFRLFIWNLISIEKEHVINIGEFKAVQEIKGPQNTELFQRLYNFLDTLEQNKIKEGSFRKKATSLKIMINQMEQNAQQKQL